MIYKRRSEQAIPARAPRQSVPESGNPRGCSRSPGTPRPKRADRFVRAERFAEILHVAFQRIQTSDVILRKLVVAVRAVLKSLNGHLSAVSFFLDPFADQIGRINSL